MPSMSIPPSPPPSPSPSPMTRRIAIVWLLGALVATGCQDKEKDAAAKLGPAFEAVLPLLERDVKQVRDGLPKGAELLAKQLDTDPGADPEGVQRAIQKARAGVHDLEVAKSTFFVFVEPGGTVIRGEQDPDLAAGKSLLAEVPDAKNIFAGAAVTELFGNMHGLRGYEQGEDLQWIVGHPTMGADGKVMGAFVTGFSLRRYADYLEVHARNHLQQAAEDKSKAIPLLYVFVVKGKRAYGGKLTPDVNAEQLGKLDLVAKAKAGDFQERVEVEGRVFLVTAKPAAALADDVAIALMISGV